VIVPQLPAGNSVQSVMGRRRVTQAAEFRGFVAGRGLFEMRDLAGQAVNLPLLGDDDLVESLDQVFGKACLDFQSHQACFKIVHTGILPADRQRLSAHEKARAAAKTGTACALANP
jgi:2-keto-3-deoxy-galactonokinase